jgi:hypothetical protein
MAIRNRYVMARLGLACASLVWVAIAGSGTATGGAEYTVPHQEDGGYPSHYDIVSEDSIGTLDFALLRYTGLHDPVCYEMQPALFDGVVSATGGGFCGDGLGPKNPVALFYGSFKLTIDPNRSESIPETLRDTSLEDTPSVDEVPVVVTAVGGAVAEEVAYVEITWANGLTTRVTPTNGGVLKVVPGPLPALEATAYDAAGRVLDNERLTLPPGITDGWI